MFQEFFTDTIESKFIKSLLRSTPLPVYSSVSDDDYVINGCTYINKYGVVRFNESGRAKDSQFIRIFPYIFNINEKSFTENFVSKYNYYDTETHEKLGDYLRIYRDINGIDLMPFYNCFSYRFFEDIYLTKDEKKENTKNCGYCIGKTDLYKVAAIPIRFDKDYVIAVDSTSPIYLKSIFHDSLGPLSINEGLGIVTQVTEELKDCEVVINDKVMTNDSCYEFTESSFNHPIHYKVSVKHEGSTDEEQRRLKSLEKYLYLLIQLPANNESSLIVLECDYNENNSYNIYNIECDYTIRYVSNENDNGDRYEEPPPFKEETIFYDDVINNILSREENYINSNVACFSEDNLYSTELFDFTMGLLNGSSDNKKNKYLLSNLSLLEMKTSKMYAFNDRLVEYLLLNVIDSLDTIDNNVTRVQETLKLTNRLDVFPSIWSDILRYSLFKKYRESKLFKENDLDINGFVDKDIEKLLIKEDGDF